MKKIYLFLFLLLSIVSYSQEFNYQAAARDASGELLVNQNIGISIAITQTSPTGLSVFTETHNITTNAYGIFNIPVGGGTNPSTTLTSIDWASFNYWLNINLDETGGTNYVLVGSSEINAVPLAINALSGTVGPQGPDGSDGADGTDGVQGIQGVAGTNGIDGAQGLPGDAGADGADGTDGVQGIQGAAGINGTNGTDGAQGLPGDAGADGVQGIQGDAGINGTNGIDGVQGLPGDAGADGVDGTDGIQGIQGDAGINGTDGTQGLPGADGNGIISTIDNGNGTFTLTYDDTTTFTTSDFSGANGVDGTNGVDGNGIASIVDNVGGTFTITYTDGTSFTSQDLTGPQGATGPEGPTGVNTNTNLTQSALTGVISYVNENAQTQTANVVSFNANNSISAGTDGGAYKQFAVVDVYNTTVSTILTNAFTTIPLNVTRTNIGGFTTTASSVVAPTKGIYEVTYSMSYNVIANNGNNNSSRSGVQTILVKGTTEILGTKSFSYHRNTVTGEGSSSKSIILTLNAGESISVSAKIESGPASIRSISNGCNLTIKLLN